MTRVFHPESTQWGTARPDSCGETSHCSLVQALKHALRHASMCYRRLGEADGYQEEEAINKRTLKLFFQKKKKLLEKCTHATLRAGPHGRLSTVLTRFHGQTATV